MARKTYRVTPSANEWLVQLEGRTVSRHYAKGEAVREARSLATASQPSQVIVHLASGRFDTEWTYGDDPFPPCGNLH